MGSPRTKQGARFLSPEEAGRARAQAKKMQNMATGMKMAQAGAETAGQVNNGVAAAGGVAPMAGAAAMAGLAGFMVSGPMVAVAGASPSPARRVAVAVPTTSAIGCIPAAVERPLASHRGRERSLLTLSA